MTTKGIIGSGNVGSALLKGLKAGKEWAAIRDGASNRSTIPVENGFQSFKNG